MHVRLRDDHTLTGAASGWRYGSAGKLLVVRFPDGTVGGLPVAEWELYSEYANKWSTLEALTAEGRIQTDEQIMRFWEVNPE